MTQEQLNEEQEHEGERYLRLIGAGHLAHEIIKKRDGSSIMARDFLEDERCAQFARPVFVELDKMDRNDPEYQKVVQGLRESITALTGIQLEAEK